MSRKLIIFATGGLCNRLRPLATAMAYAKKYDRELLVLWSKEIHCSASYKEMLGNDLNILTIQDFNNLGFDYKQTDTMEQQKKISKQLAIKYSWANNQKQLLSTDAKNILVVGNNFDADVRQESMDELKTIIPCKDLADLIAEYVTLLELDKSVQGVHARGTDMPGVSYEYYAQRMRTIYDEGLRMYMATEDASFTERFTKDFPGILTTPHAKFAIKERPNDTGAHNGWAYNLKITEEASRSAMIDLFLLSKTTLSIFCHNSSFAECARIIGEDK